MEQSIKPRAEDSSISILAQNNILARATNYSHHLTAEDEAWWCGGGAKDAWAQSATLSICAQRRAFYCHYSIFLQTSIMPLQNEASSKTSGERVWKIQKIPKTHPPSLTCSFGMCVLAVGTTESGHILSSR